jgi:hypothetical protein
VTVIEAAVFGAERIERRVMNKGTGRAAVGAIAIWALWGAGCGGGCPGANSSADAKKQWEAELDKRSELKLKPGGAITIKRDVHNIVVSADADKLAKAFHDVMRDPNRHFGLIKVDRKEAEKGQPFKENDRFQGRYEVDQAILKDLRGAWAKKIFGDFVKEPAVEDFLCQVENHSTSDYGIIRKLNLSPKAGEDYEISYHYLDGSPIAGSSTFVVSQIAPGMSRLTQIFEYQELSPTFALFFSSGGLKLHDQVVYSQATQAAELIGAKVVSSDIPDDYKNP